MKTIVTWRLRVKLATVWILDQFSIWGCMKIHRGSRPQSQWEMRRSQWYRKFVDRRSATRPPSLFFAMVTQPVFCNGFLQMDKNFSENGSIWFFRVKNVKTLFGRFSFFDRSQYFYAQRGVRKSKNAMEQWTLLTNGKKCKSGFLNKTKIKQKCQMFELFVIFVKSCIQSH